MPLSDRSPDGGMIVENLQTVFLTGASPLKAVDGVSFRIERGQVLGLVGESGSGKSVTGFSLMRLVDEPGRVVGGRVLLDGVDLLALSDAEMRRYRGARIAMIFQDPMMTLNPVLSIDTQMIEAILAHRKVSRSEARNQARDALGSVGIPSPDERLKAYPHQLSGGMRQRVVIAIALLHSPDVIIADEATTALDVTIQSQILATVQQLCQDHGTSLIWITHDLSVVAGIADAICVMYGGKIVEYGTVDQVLGAPIHPYTRALIRSLPGEGRKGYPLQQIGGTTPSLADLPAGCAFQPRCDRASEICGSAPPLSVVEDGREYRCFHPNVAGGAARGMQP